MSELPQSIPPESADTLNPDVSIFREVALLHLPAEWRPACRQLGIWLFDWTLERFGIAGEEPDTLRQTRARMNAIAADLKTARDMLWGLKAEAGQSEMGEEEYRLLRTCNSYIAEFVLPKFIQMEEVEQRGVLSRAEVVAMTAWIEARETEGLKALATFAKIRAGEPVTDEEREHAERVCGMPLSPKKDKSD